MPADQTWMGYIGEANFRPGSPSCGSTVKAARDGVVESLQARHGPGARPLRGFEGDDVARRIITDAGYGEYFIHRTGHSIDLDIHGRGPNLDNLETRDDRVLVPGVGFSVEPGIYIPDDVGLRTEINVYMGPAGSGGHGVGARSRTSSCCWEVLEGAAVRGQSGPSTESVLMAAGPPFASSRWRFRYRLRRAFTYRVAGNPPARGRTRACWCRFSNRSAGGMG